MRGGLNAKRGKYVSSDSRTLPHVSKRLLISTVIVSLQVGCSYGHSKLAHTTPSVSHIFPSELPVLSWEKLIIADQERVGAYHYQAFGKSVFLVVISENPKHNAKNFEAVSVLHEEAVDLILTSEMHSGETHSRKATCERLKYSFRKRGLSPLASCEKPILTPDPQTFRGIDPEISEVLARSGLDATDFFSVYALVRLTAWWATSGLSPDHFTDEGFGNLVPGIRDVFTNRAEVPVADLAEVDSLDELKDWYAEKAGRPLKDPAMIFKFSKNDRRESWGQLPHFIEVIANARYQLIFENLRDALEQSATVGIILNQGEYAAIAPALEASFGSPLPIH